MWWISLAWSIEVGVGPGLEFETIADAIAAIGPDVTVLQLEEGEYARFQWDAPRALEIVGRGPGTVLRVDSEIRVRPGEDGGRLVLRDLVVQGDGTRPLLEIDPGQGVGATVELVDVELSRGGVRDQSDGYGVFWERDAPIEVRERGRLVATRARFADNTGPYGGHVHVRGGELELVDCELIGGQGVYEGGAVALTDGATARVVGGRVVGNQARLGAAFHVEAGASLELEGVGLLRNEGQDTGAIHVDGGRLLVVRGRFFDNRGETGGAIRASGDVRVEGSIFAGNEASASGGAVSCAGPCAIVDNVWTGNRAPRGAALQLTGDGGQTARNAFCESVGGAVSLEGANRALSHSLFWANRGPAISVAGGSVELRNLVFADNVDAAATALHQTSGRVVLSDSLFTDNRHSAPDEPTALLVRAERPEDVTLAFIADWRNPMSSSPGVARLGAQIDRDPRVHVEPASPEEAGRRCRLADWKLLPDSPLRGVASTDGRDIGIYDGPDSPEADDDLDRDGLAARYDCDDLDPTAGLPRQVYPNDRDGDGYADLAEPGTPYRACPSPGRALHLGDCDDADATRYPGAPEDVGGPDRDCDTWRDPAVSLGRGCGSLPGHGGSAAWLVALGVILRTRVALNRSRRCASASGNGSY